MQIYGVTWEQIETAAETAGVRANGDPMHCTIRTRPRRFVPTRAIRDRRVAPRYQWSGWLAFDTANPYGPHQRCATRAECALVCGQIKWRKIGRGGRTHPGSVCWHGHRDFMREVFRVNPDARIKTCLADYYRGAEDFEAKYRATQPIRTGWGASGATCDCDEA